MANTAQLLTNQATALGYDALSERDLKEALIVVATAGVPPGSNAQTLVTLAASLDYGALSEKGVLLALVGFYAGSTTAQSAVNSSALSGRGAMSDLDLDNALLSVLTGTAGNRSAKTVVANAASHNYPALSRRGLQECLLAAAQVASASDAQSLTNTASTEKDPALSGRDLNEALVAAQ